MAVQIKLFAGIVRYVRIFFRSACQLFKKRYTKERFLLELEHEADYFFRAQIEWEMLFPPMNIAKHSKYNALAWYKIDVYEQLRVNWERFADYMWAECQKAENK